MEDINENQLKERAYRIACEHGWHDEEHPDAHWLMLIITEIAEAVQADRKDKHADREQYIWLIDYALREDMLKGDILEQYKKEAFENCIKDTFEDELADIVIRCYDFAGLRNINFEIFRLSKVNVDDQFWEEIYNMTVPEFMYTITSLVSDHVTANFKRILSAIFLIADYAGYHNIPLMWYVKEKINYNENRPYKHGRKY